jgi:hypothetical protein
LAETEVVKIGTWKLLFRMLVVVVATLWDRSDRLRILKCPELTLLDRQKLEAGFLEPV